MFVHGKRTFNYEFMAQLRQVTYTKVSCAFVYVPQSRPRYIS